MIKFLLALKTNQKAHLAHQYFQLVTLCFGKNQLFLFGKTWFGKGPETEEVVLTNMLWYVFIFCCFYPLDEKMVTWCTLKFSKNWVANNTFTLSIPTDLNSNSP